MYFSFQPLACCPWRARRNPPPAQAVEWRSVSWLDNKPPFGTTHTLTNVVHDPNDPNNITGVTYAQTPCTGNPTSQDESAEDWWYAHTNVYDAAHNLIGYAAAGYATPPNWSGDFGCVQFPLLEISLENLDMWERRRGALFAMVSLFDLEGHMIWCGDPFIPGTFYGVAQAGDGGPIVCIGEATVNRTHPDPNRSMPIHYNPMAGNPGPNYAQFCGPGDFNYKTCIASFALDGTPQWVNLYGPVATQQEAWSTKARGQYIRPMTIGGQAGLLAVGYGRATPGATVNSGMVLRLNLNGELVTPPAFYGAGTSGLGAMNIQANESLSFMCVDLATDAANVQHAVITGGITWLPVRPRRAS